MAEILQVVPSSLPKQSNGHDGISSKLLNFNKKCNMPLCLIFITSFLTDKFPALLKIANIFLTCN